MVARSAVLGPSNDEDRQCRRRRDTSESQLDTDRPCTSLSPPGKPLRYGSVSGCAFGVTEFSLVQILRLVVRSQDWIPRRPFRWINHTTPISPLLHTIPITLRCCLICPPLHDSIRWDRCCADSLLLLNPDSDSDSNANAYASPESTGLWFETQDAAASRLHRQD
jgi:hypothetical protein